MNMPPFKYDFPQLEIKLPFPKSLLRSLSALLLAVSVSACAVPTEQSRPASDAEPASSSLRLAQATAKSGDHQTAARLFENIVEEEPESVAALLGLGDSYSRLGQQNRAAAVLNRAHELDNRNVEVLSVLGRVHLSQHQAETALANYNKALKIDRSNISAITGKGVALDTLSRHAEAQKVYQSGLSQYPANYVLRNNYALSLALSGQQTKSIAILQELVRDPVVAPHVRDNLAMVYGLAGREDDARATLALDLEAGQIEENMEIYRALRRMLGEGKKVGALVYA